MIKKFILTYQRNRMLGAILAPAIARKEEKSSFYQIQPVIPETTQSEIPNYSEHIQSILDLCFQINEKGINQYFNKKSSPQTTFFQNLEKPFLQKHIRPFIDDKILQILEIAAREKVDIYYLQSKNIFETDRLSLNIDPLACQFEFNYHDNQLTYKLKLFQNNQPIKLLNQKIFILSEAPSIFLMNQEIYVIQDFNTKKIIPFVSKDQIEIPEKFVDDYFKTFIRNAIKSHTVSAKGFEIEESKIQPKGILKIHTGINQHLSLSLSFLYDNISVRPDQVANNALVTFNAEAKKFKKIKRLPSEEKAIIDKLVKFGLKPKGGIVYGLENTFNSYEIIEWINNNSEQLSINNIIIQSDLDKKYFLGKIEIQLKTEEKNDWFDLYGTVQLGQFEIPFVKLRNHIMKGIREYELPDKTIAIIPETWFSQFTDVFSLSQKEGDTLRINKYQVDLLSKINHKQAQNFTVQFQALIEDKTNYETPKEIQATLREYQTEGYSWMRKLRDYQFGGCLADDMGLGKTLQTLTLLAYHHTNVAKKEKSNIEKPNTNQLDLFADHLHDLEKNATSLIVAPASLVHNWENEIRKFAPSLKTKNFTGTSRTQNINNFRYYDLIITTYGVIRNDVDSLKKFIFDYIVLDESQNIKNPASVTYKSVKQLNANHKLVLTGTPIENSLTDLWAQLNFINPGLIGTQKWFKDYYASPIEKQQDEAKLQKLKTLTAPFVLRRTKSEVAKDLPPITEQTIMCEMSSKQETLYEEHKSATRNTLLEAFNDVSKTNHTTLILKALNELRQLANNPNMLNPEFTKESGKTEIVTRHIENLVAEKHKVLIFSSFVKHLNVVEQICKERNWTYSRLTGQTKNREKVIEEFQNNDNNHIFLISLKAGGVGLNLTAADYVLMLDPWWNPAAEAQAVNRAHRIGQDKNVFVYRYITRDTIEEKIVNLQSKKQKLSDELINDNMALKNMSHQEIKDLFN
jgi:SNF2 family DNA or RNA helicase